jgi:hypothetical protein
MEGRERTRCHCGVGSPSLDQRGWHVHRLDRIAEPPEVMAAMQVASRKHVNLLELQHTSKKFMTPDGKRPNGLFAPGVMVGKTLYISGKGDYRPEADLPEKVKNCLHEIRKTLQLSTLNAQPQA